uniref:Transmembrane protein n=1 Tax=Fagus sylvatica TaxID=28930 RepID=A0A2N9FFJ2_FAGSY
MASRWTSGLHRSEADLSLAQRGSRKDRSLSFSRGGVLLVCGGRWWGFVEFLVGFCWFVVAGGGAFVDFVVGLVVGHDGIVDGYAFRWVEVGVVASDCRWLAVIVGGCG